MEYAKSISLIIEKVYGKKLGTRCAFVIEIRWRTLDDEDPGWKSCRCLYAYLTPNGKEILYIGKAWSATVRDRWYKKRVFWKDLEKQRGIKYTIPLIGEVYLFGEQRLTRELLADIESLLINIEKPWGNIQCQKDRIRRPSMQVKCTSKWPKRRKIYEDK